MDASQRAKVGLLVLGCSALFVAMLAFILGGRMGAQTEAFFISFDENVKGMVVGSKVNFQGVPVGAVRDIRFTQGRTVVEISVDPERAVVQTVTRARLDRLLVTGQVTIELEGWRSDARSLSPGDSIEPMLSPLNQITNSLPDTLARVDGLMVRLDTVLSHVEQVLGPANQKQLADILVHANGLGALLRERLPVLIDQLHARASELGPVQEDLRRCLVAMTRLSERSEAAVGNLPELLQTARKTLEQFGSLEARVTALFAEAQGMLGSVRAPMHESLGQARQAFAELQALARHLRLAPSSLLFGRDSAEINLPATAPPGERR